MTEDKEKIKTILNKEPLPQKTATTAILQLRIVRKEVTLFLVLI
jgi:hypothetical protein